MHFGSVCLFYRAEFPHSPLFDGCFALRAYRCLEKYEFEIVELKQEPNAVAQTLVSR